MQPLASPLASPLLQPLSAAQSNQHTKWACCRTTLAVAATTQEEQAHNEREGVGAERAITENPKDGGSKAALRAAAVVENAVERESKNAAAAAATAAAAAAAATAWGWGAAAVAGTLSTPHASQ